MDREETPLADGNVSAVVRRRRRGAPSSPPLASFAPRADGRVVSYEPSQHAKERARRLQLMEVAYGLPMEDLLPTVARRLEAVCELLMARAEAGDEAYRRLVAEGHLGYYRREVAFVRRHTSEWRPSAG